MRFNLAKREAASFILLRRQGYSINTLATAFGRSRSLIHRILRANGLTHLDMRKLPTRIKQLCAQRQRLGMIRYLQSWEAWALGEGDKPP